ncbi:MAG: IS4 family transposase [Chlorobiaceae bacterium]|nr:IS4 family transposase [Chlorobiaceae bacterium]
MGNGDIKSDQTIDISPIHKEFQTMKQVTAMLGELLKIFPRYEFEKLEKQHQNNHYTKYFTGWQQLITLFYAEIVGHNSLRGIQTSLGVHTQKWFHLGLESIKRSTLSDAMKNRPHQIYEGLFYKLLEKCRSVTPDHKFRFKNPLFSMDATVIDLCLSVFPRAEFRQRKGAIKLHYLYDHHGSLPAFMVMTDTKRHDVRVARSQEKLDFYLLPDSIISFDRAYIDFKWLYTLDQRKVWFVTRSKTNIQYRILGQHQPIRNKQVTRDERIELIIEKSRAKYPKPLRLVCYTDPDTGKEYEFSTNNMKLAASTIAAIYKSRWQIETFFRWIRQNLKIKSFLGTSQNAVLTQIWVAMCYYLLLSYIKFQTKYRHFLQELTRMIAAVVMEQRLLIDILSLKVQSLKKVRDPVSQLALF